MSKQSGVYRATSWCSLVVAGLVILICLTIWLLSVAAIFEFRGIKNDLFLRGGRLFIVHYETKWKGHKAAIQQGERIIKEADSELVIERQICPHCGSTIVDTNDVRHCAQCGGPTQLETETIAWQPPGGLKYSYLGFGRTYPYFVLSIDPRNLISAHSTGWTVNIPTAIFVFMTPLMLFLMTRVGRKASVPKLSNSQN